MKKAIEIIHDLEKFYCDIDPAIFDCDLEELDEYIEEELTSYCEEDPTIDALENRALQCSIDFFGLEYPMILKYSRNVSV